jgi:hypothetical protein
LNYLESKLFIAGRAQSNSPATPCRLGPAHQPGPSTCHMCIPSLPVVKRVSAAHPRPVRARARHRRTGPPFFLFPTRRAGPLSLFLFPCFGKEPPCPSPSLQFFSFARVGSPARPPKPLVVNRGRLTNSGDQSRFFSPEVAQNTWPPPPSPVRPILLPLHLSINLCLMFLSLS